MKPRFHEKIIHSFFFGCVHFANFFLRHFLKKRYVKRTVLHISYLVHIPFYTTRILRDLGYQADYLAIGTDPHWKKCDYQFIRNPRWYLNILREFYYFWTVVATYEIIHSHFMVSLSYSGWEIPLLKKMGRKLVIHYRGCEVRDWEKNQKLHPSMNICQNCDYNRSICTSQRIRHQRELSEKYGDLFFVTTPDLKDFIPHSVHLPFFSPPTVKPRKQSVRFKIVHATNHPGIEGTESIIKAVENLQSKGYDIEFKNLKDVPYDDILNELADASLSIGKLKMGYYANFQIESMTMGVPAITFIRPEYLTEELKNSGLILTTLDKIEETIEFYFNNRDQLAIKQRKARESILKLHDNKAIGQQMIEYYDNLSGNN
jgi:hypothetical protein